MGKKNKLKKLRKKKRKNKQKSKTEKPRKQGWKNTAAFDPVLRDLGFVWRKKKLAVDEKLALTAKILPPGGKYKLGLVLRALK